MSTQVPRLPCNHPFVAKNGLGFIGFLGFLGFIGFIGFIGLIGLIGFIEGF